MSENSLSFEALTKRDTYRPYAASYMGLHSTQDGIELRNHDFVESIEILFADIGRLIFLNSIRSPWDKIRRKGSLIEYELFNNDTREQVLLKRAPLGTEEFFQTSGTLLDLGCGPGQTPLEIAAKFPHITVVGVDYEFGRQIIPPPYDFPNLTYLNDNWGDLSLDDQSVDRIISTSAAFTYGKPAEVVPEVTRVAKAGAMLRAQTMPYPNDPAIENGDLNTPGSAYAFSRTLASQGWVVWNASGYHIMAKKK